MTEVSPHDTERIWSRACQTFPSISRAKILEEVVGLRPHREDLALVQSPVGVPQTHLWIAENQGVKIELPMHGMLSAYP